MAKPTKRAKAPKTPAQAKGTPKRERDQPGRKSPSAVKSATAIARPSRSPETTGREQGVRADVLTRFQPGQSGNPKGRPRGSRHRLGEDLLAALADDFEAHGVKVIEQVREERPQDYLKILAGILPKEVDVAVSQYDTMSEEQLRAQIRASWREAIDLGIDLGIVLNDEAVH